MIAITMCVRHWLGALYSSLYIETGHKESFLPFFPSLVHSSILHLPFVSPFLFAHFHFYARHYFPLTPIPSFLLFISFPFFHFFSICFVRASLLPPPHPSSSSRLRSSSPPSLHRTLSVPCPAFPFHLLARSLAPPPAANHVRSRSLPHFSSVRSRSLVNPKQQVPTLLAALRTVRVCWTAFCRWCCSLAGRSNVGHVARFGRGFHFQKNPDRTIPLGSRVKHRSTRSHLSTWSPIIDSNQPFPRPLAYK